MSIQIVEQQHRSNVNSLRSLGQTDQQIAINLDLPLAYVEAIPPPRPKPDRSRAVQHQQLMKMAQALMPKVEAGDREAIQTMLKVMQREASLLGLDAPKEVINKNFVADMRDPKDLRTYTTQELQQMLADMNAIQGEATRHD